MDRKILKIRFGRCRQEQTLNKRDVQFLINPLDLLLLHKDCIIFNNEVSTFFLLGPIGYVSLVQPLRKLRTIHPGIP